MLKYIKKKKGDEEGKQRKKKV